MKNSVEENTGTGKEQNHVKEPESIYAKKRLRSFTSFEEMNNADAAEMATMSGVQHLMNVTALLKRIYTKELTKKMDLKLYRKEGWTSY